MFTDCVTRNNAATKFLFSSPFGLFTLCTVAGRSRALWLRTADWWSAWRGVTGYSSFSILRCCPNTRGSPLSPNTGGRSHPRPRRGLQNVPWCFLQLWISHMKFAHGESLIITFINALSEKKKNQYLIRSVLFGAKYLNDSTCRMAATMSLHVWWTVSFIICIHQILQQEWLRLLDPGKQDSSKSFFSFKNREKCQSLVEAETILDKTLAFTFRWPGCLYPVAPTVSQPCLGIYLKLS